MNDALWFLAFWPQIFAGVYAADALWHKLAELVGRLVMGGAL